MKANIELKAYCADPARVAGELAALGAEALSSGRQVDTYFSVHPGYLKLRRAEGRPPELIAYRRLSAPLPRESSYRRLGLGADADELATFLSAALGAHATIDKRRTTLRRGACLVHLDEVAELGGFVEIEAEVERAGSTDAARSEADELAAELGIESADILPWSYSELSVLRRAAAERRAASALAGGKILLIDGPSASGKSTLLDAAARTGAATVIRRLTTRAPREQDDGPADDDAHMRFVPDCEFRRALRDGELLEFRDFLFGMSYGLPWGPALAALRRGRTPAGLINLGNGPHVQRYVPEVVTILVDSPVEEIRTRLLRRGTHTEEQIEERLANARRVHGYRDRYDHVIDNREGRLAESIERLREILDAECGERA